MMIGCFPDPYPDELLYSVFARLSDHVQYPSPKSLVRDLFGNEAVNAAIQLPSHLGYLVDALPPGHRYTVDRLIDEHTLLPFYGPFLPPERLNQLRQDMYGNDGRHIHGRAGIRASRIPLPECLRFCPLCAANDRTHFGEYYWHRIHQVPGVEVCPVHALWLQKSNVRVWNRQKHLFISAEQAIPGATGSSLKPLTVDDEPLLLLARDVVWLLGQGNPIPDPASLASRYLNLLADEGLATYSGVVHTRRLLATLEHHYPPGLLRLLSCEFAETQYAPWPVRLIRPTLGAQHPICHLLLMQFLGYTAQTFFNLPTVRKPFGDSPWPCLNPTSDHYRRPLIQTHQITYNGNIQKLVGTFACKECGFIYTRIGPETSPEDRYRPKTIKAFGSVWEETLRKLWADPTVNLTMAKRQLGINAMATLHRQAARLGLPSPKPGARSHIAVNLAPRPHHYHISPTTRNTYRTTFLAAKKENPEAGVSGLRRKIPKEYDWLQRHDREWFEANRPPSLKPKYAKKPNAYSADWHSRDTEFVAKVIPTVLHLKSTPGCPVRLTRTMLSREIGIRHLSYLPKLPLTCQALDEVVETVEKYYVRRVWWAVDLYRQAKIKPKRWQLVRRAGVSRRASHPLVRDAIDAALQELKSTIAA